MSDEATTRFLEDCYEKLGIEIMITIGNEEIVSKSARGFEGAEENLGKLQRSLNKHLLDVYGR